MNYEEFEDMLEGYPKGVYVTVQPESIEDQRRWVTVFSKVVQKVSTGEYFSLVWERGSTEMQDMDGEDMYWSVSRCEPKEKVVTYYEDTEVLGSSL